MNLPRYEELGDEAFLNTPPPPDDGGSDTLSGAPGGDDTPNGPSEEERTTAPVDAAGTSAGSPGDAGPSDAGNARSQHELSDEELGDPPQEPASPNAGTATGAGTGAEAEKQAGTEGVSPSGSGEGAAADASKDGTKEGDPTKAADPAEASGDAPAEAPDYEAFYKQITAPLKAGKRTITVKSPEEAISLMQQGADYTRKMQQLAPHRKTLLMLENNGLLDEGKLSLLIDVSKGDKAAIQKLLKDTGIDPMDFDTDKPPEYTAGNHQVTDKELAFKTVLEDLRSTEDGLGTLTDIQRTWDQASIAELWADPEIMNLIHSQRQTGIYGRIVEEMERRKTFGKLRDTVPFLQAYHDVGKELDQAGAFADLSPAKRTASTPPSNPTGVAAPGASPPAGTMPKTTTTPAAPVAVGTKVGTPAPPVTNGDKAQAASITTRSGPARGRPQIQDYSNVSDEEFLALPPPPLQHARA